MNKDLLEMTEDFIEVMRGKEGILGAWNFGSETHGLSDEYSDVDLIFLIDENHYKPVNKRLSEYMTKVCDEILICWPESFNSEAITNYGFLVKKYEKIFQFDLFLLNENMLDDFMCQIHYTDLQPEHIIFDCEGKILKLVEKAPKGFVLDSEIKGLADTYWFHMNMTIKYLLRHDFFKLNNVMRILMDTHSTLLLTGYDQLTWGGMGNKLHFISEEKQSHLKKYYCTDDFALLANNLRQAMNWFKEDYKDVCQIKGVSCNEKVEDGVINTWKNAMEDYM